MTQATMPTRRPPANGRPIPSAPKFTVSRGVTRKSWKVGIYGPEGIGKSSLAALCPGAVFADLEHSTEDMDLSRVDGIEVPLPDTLAGFAASWVNLRAWVQSLSAGANVIDSMTRAEDWCAAWVIKNKRSSEGAAASDSLEDFKYKAGLTFVVDEYRRFLGDIDNAFIRGASFILIAHERISRIKNPDGSDFIRHEPRLIDDAKGSNMSQFVQFLDHLLFIDLDKNVDKRGKVQGSGSRTIYLDTAPSRLSKTRSLPMDPMPFDRGETQLWSLLGANVAGAK